MQPDASFKNIALENTSQRSFAVDEAVRRAFQETEPAVTVVAVGGYGRAELFPFSDVDLVLLADGALTPAEREPLAEFVRLLWDAELRVGQSVHTAAECCEMHDGNLELTISLLDRRLVAGNSQRYSELQRLFPKFLDTHRDEVMTHLAAMTRGRHAKYGDTIYHLEPNLKEYPGGLRDLHVIGWLRKLKAFEAAPTETAQTFLFQLRTRLHLHSGRDNNLLTFEAQDALLPDPAEGMREYYRNAREIDVAVQRALEICEPLNRGLFSNFRDWRSRLSNEWFTVSRERVLLRHPATLTSDCDSVFRLMEFMARHDLRLAPDTEARLEKVRGLHCTWRDLKTVLALPRCVNAVRAMARLHLLEQAIPEWRRIDCLVVRDFYHRYTVDEHTLVTLDALEALPAEQGRGHFAALWSEIEHPEALRLALLLHDIGKGEGGGDHARRSAEIARAVLERLEAPDDVLETVLFLIEHHLDLSSTMTSRDLSEASTARQIADRTGTMERLRLLTLMTYADISAVNPTAMTPWRLEQLWQVYRTGNEEFTRELEGERIHSTFLKWQAPDAAAEFLEGFPTRYLRTHTREQVAAHVELAQRENAVDVERIDGTYCATVLSRDRPFLLASISGALASFGMNILKAEAFTNRRGQALDTFVFDDPHRTLELNPGETERLRDLLMDAVSGAVDVRTLMEKRRRAAGKERVAPAVSVSNDVSETATLVEISAEDRPGLLYDFTNAISSEGANIEVVLVDTEAHRALDVFYITADGVKLTEERMGHLKQRMLQACRPGP